MTDYIAITESETDPGAPATSELAKKWRDNPLAIAEGAVGAPLISGAIRKIIDQQEIGAFIFARGPSTTAYGDVVAGSSLTYAGAISSASAVAGVPNSSTLRTISFNAGASGSPVGSWVCLGRIDVSASANTSDGTADSVSATGATLWQRVA